MSHRWIWQLFASDRLNLVTELAVCALSQSLNQNPGGVAKAGLPSEAKGSLPLIAVLSFSQFEVIYLQVLQQFFDKGDFFLVMKQETELMLIRREMLHLAMPKLCVCFIAAGSWLWMMSLVPHCGNVTCNRTWEGERRLRCCFFSLHLIKWTQS